ncbi:hypothetical protein [Deinococcus sp.]|uniref:hypothetical protein n=1 Tax=Deinococcus sp. TaxID=47478 RepID=UPI0028699B92|nr:hypothetical protein [Deinococcus sp.]
MRRALTAVIAAVLGSSALADDWAAPVPRLFVSEGGPTAYGFKVLPQNPALGAQARGELFTLSPDGRVPTVWRGQLRNLPLTVTISPQGEVVTVDTYGGDQQGRHALVIYSLSGTVLTDLPYAAIVTERPAHPRSQVGGLSGPFLSQVYALTLAFDGRWTLVFKDALGHGPVFDAATGKRIR